MGMWWGQEGDPPVWMAEEELSEQKLNGYNAKWWKSFHTGEEGMQRPWVRNKLTVLESQKESQHG